MVVISAQAVSAFDETINVAITQLEPNQLITISARTSRNQVTFVSFANFQATNDGTVSLDRDFAISGGTYEGCETMGLFWSMQVVDETQRDIKIISGPDLDSLTYQLTVISGHHSSMADILPKLENGNALDEITIERQFMTQGVTRIPVKHGRMRGLLFLPKGEGPFPAIIDIFPLVNGIIAFRGSLFARHGIACLCVAYQAYEDLPLFITAVDCSYFMEAFDFLASHPAIDGDNIGIHGDCLAGNIALAVARCQPKIKAVVALQPPLIAVAYDFHLPLGEKDADGKDVVTVIPGVRNITAEISEINGVRVGLPRAKLINDWRDHALWVGKIKASILLIFGKDDCFVDINIVYPVAKAQLEEGSKVNAEIVVYDKVGHGLAPPHYPVSQKRFIPTLCRTAPVWFGGELAAQGRAQEDVWCKTIAFFRDKLSSNKALCDGGSAAA